MSTHTPITIAIIVYSTWASTSCTEWSKSIKYLLVTDILLEERGALFVLHEVCVDTVTAKELVVHEVTRAWVVIIDNNRVVVTRDQVLLIRWALIIEGSLVDSSLWYWTLLWLYIVFRWLRYDLLYSWVYWVSANNQIKPNRLLLLLQ